jgi:hypothetical protein
MGPRSLSIRQFEEAMENQKAAAMAQVDSNHDSHSRDETNRIGFWAPGGEKAEGYYGLIE